MGGSWAPTHLLLQTILLIAVGHCLYYTKGLATLCSHTAAAEGQVCPHTACCRHARDRTSELLTSFGVLLGALKPAHLLLPLLLLVTGEGTDALPAVGAPSWESDHGLPPTAPALRLLLLLGSLLRASPTLFLGLGLSLGCRGFLFLVILLFICAALLGAIRGCGIC